MPLIFLGSVSAASDATMATVTNTVSSQFRVALSALITAVLSQNPTVIAAAQAAATAAAKTAVDAEILASRLVASDPDDTAVASSRKAVPLLVRERTKSVFYPSIYPAVYPPASYTPAVARSVTVPALGPDGTLPREMLPTLQVGLQVAAVEGGPAVLKVLPDGSTWINKAVINEGGGSPATKVSRVVVVAALGQSNQVAHGQPVVPLLDGASSRIWQLPTGTSVLVPAVVPLTMPGATASGLSPSHVLAREIAREDPDCVVVIVPAAKGGSGLVTDPSAGFGKWQIDYTGPNPRLYADAITAMNVALAQIATRWGVTPSIVTTWLQGEQDGADGITRAVYTSALDALIADWRGRYGGIFLIAGIVPQAATSGTRPEVVLALQDTPRRVQRTAFVPGVDNGGGARGPSDVIHYGREALEVIGRDWYRAIPRADNNIAASPTTPPLKVSATRWGSEVTVDWTPPYCRVTAFEVQSSKDGVAWSNVAIVEPVATRAVFTSADPVKVRVRAIGKDTSNWTAPVVALAS